MSYKLQIELLFSNRRKSSLQLKQTGPNLYKLLAPQTFDTPPLRIKITKWAKFQIALNPQLKAKSSEFLKLRQEIQRLLGSNIITKKQSLPSKTSGKHHDLKDTQSTINNKYFNSDLPLIQISWSPQIGGRSFHRKTQTEQGQIHYISISQGYDFKNCPAYAIQGVVYHECLHAFLPEMLGKTGKRIIHGKKFKNLEQKFEFYREWRAWHAQILPKNILWLKTKHKIRSIWPANN